ncbi:cysteine rich repeat-containing protein [Roseibium sp.]|uniref:cysteine rich repeat-containing protein n=1 Tax=Roseibium sp. TaxID=1936156 RepID=UPI0035152473
MRFLISALLLLGVSGAHAQELTRQQMREIRTACEADVRSLCSGIQPGGGRLLQCLQANAANMSPSCANKLLELQALRPPQ